jgi:hypothetical protein
VITATYSGRELDAPLLRLLQELRGQEATLRTSLKQYAHDNENDFVRWATLGATSTTEQRNDTARKLMATITRLRETELWLFECRRKPRQKWRLNLQQLAELYPTQIAPETTADMLIAESPGWVWSWKR